MTYGLLPGADQGEVAVEGVRFAVHHAGPKNAATTPVLLLHGVPQTAVSFRHLLPELAKDRRVIAPDLKGLGESEVKGPYDVPTLVREIAALILHEVDGRVDVVGHDWGGSLALALAGARPDLVRRLVVVNAPYRHVNLLAAFHIPLFDLPLLPESAFAVAGRRLIRLMLSSPWKAAAPLDAVIRTHYERVYTEPERIAAMLSYYRVNTRPRLATLRRRAAGSSTHRPRETKVRAERKLVLWGAADPVLPMSVAESVVRDLGSDTTLVALPGIGHFPLEEAPDDAVPVVAAFLREGESDVVAGAASDDAVADTDALDDDAVSGADALDGDAAAGADLRDDDAAAASPRAPVPVSIEAPISPRTKAIGRDPDAQRANARRKVAETQADTARKAAARRARRAAATEPDAGTASPDAGKPDAGKPDAGKPDTDVPTEE